MLFLDVINLYLGSRAVSYTHLDVYKRQALDKLDWPEKVKKMQTDWIGKSYGAEVEFPVKGRDEKITVYTTRPDTLHGATFMVLSPEHKLAKELATDETREAVEKYIFDASMKSNVDRCLLYTSCITA